MLPVKHLAQKIIKIMAVNYCGRQLAQWLWRAAPAFHKKEGAAPHHVACKFSLQYDERPDVRFGMWNVDSLSGKGEKEDD